MLGRQSPQMDLADAVLWTGKIEPGQLVEKGSFHDRFAKLRPTVLRDEDFEHWFNEETGRPSVAPSVVAGAFLLALREDCSDREAEQRMRYDLRWKWALGLGLTDHGCDHSSLCVFRGRPAGPCRGEQALPGHGGPSGERRAAAEAGGTGDG